MVNKKRSEIDCFAVQYSTSCGKATHMPTQYAAVCNVTGHGKLIISVFCRRKWTPILYNSRMLHHIAAVGWLYSKRNCTLLKQMEKKLNAI